MTTLARGPMGAQVAAEEPDGTGHPALRALPAVWCCADLDGLASAVAVMARSHPGQPRPTGEARRAGS